MSTDRLPESFPFLEPCPGCFENALQRLSEKPGNSPFLSNGDFTLIRLISALSKLVYGADVTLCVFRLSADTLKYLKEVKLSGCIGTVSVIYNSTDATDDDMASYSQSFTLSRVDTTTQILYMHNADRSLAVSGAFMQDAPSRCVELYTLYADAEQLSVLFRGIQSRLTPHTL